MELVQSFQSKYSLQLASFPLKKQGGPIVYRAAEAFHCINTSTSRGTIYIGEAEETAFLTFCN